MRVKRINQKSISLIPIDRVDGKWVERKEIVRIPKIAREGDRMSRLKAVKPLFARDNSRLD